mmetsp:Transcript_67882/g.191343  ORF Transcript_67882/g.191343 Transcript_67882/m.191343 type:complete len:423 (-) Transcript_67882:168-1436(-)
MGGHRRLWEVVGGADKHGILVREGCELSSTQMPDRLSTGSCVREVELVGDRLRYEKLTGMGPGAGWVSVKVAGKELVVEIAEEALPQPMPTLGGPQIRVCTWNLLAPCYHRAPTGQKEVQTKFWKPRVAAQLAAVTDITNPDILCLQELWFSPTVMDMVGQLAKARGYDVVTCRRTGAKMDGVAALVRGSRLEVLASEEQEICSMGDRVALWLLLRLRPAAGEAAGAGHTLVLGTTHFTFPHGEQEEDQQLHQSARVRDHCSGFARRHRLRPGEAPCVLAGDFNCRRGPGDDEAVGSLVAAGWRSAFSEAHGREAAATHCTHRDKLTCADLVLVHGDVGVTGATLLPAGEPDTAAIPRPEVGGADGLLVPRTVRDWSQFSDHRPLVATLSLGPRGGEHRGTEDHPGLAWDTREAEQELIAVF